MPGNSDWQQLTYGTISTMTSLSRENADDTLDT